MTINGHRISLPIYNNLNNTNIIPPRCEIIKAFNIPNVLEESVIKSQEILPGLFCANVIVNAAQPFLKFINTTDNSIAIPNEFQPQFEPLTNFCFYSKVNNTNKTERKQQLLKEIRTEGLEPHIKQNLEQLCLEFNDIFSLENDVLTENNFYKQSITLNDKNPVYIKNYRTPESQRTEINQQVEKMYREGIIRDSTSPYNSPILLVPKKSNNGDKKWRLVVDFRQLNKKITPDKFPLPRIDEILDQLGRAKYFTTLDLMSGFHQIPLDEQSKKYTAFSSSTGHFEFQRLPFGLNISPNSFQRMMSIALSGLTPECAFLYIDDIIVVGCSIKTHLMNLRKVFSKLRKYNLKLNPSKCFFFRSDVTYLGHHISEKGIQPDKSKFKSIHEYPTPKSADEARRFVAFCNYYRRFIQNFAQIAQPQNHLLKKDVPFKWTQACQDAFDKLRQELLSPKILQFPDFSEEFIVTTDASKLACGAVLAQKVNDVEMPIAFASKSFTKGESNKSTIEQELTAIHWAINYFRPYLYGRKFIIKTDHRPLIYLFSMRNPSSKLTRMRLELEEYDFIVQYIKGKSNYVSDALSRIEIDSDKLKSMYIITRSMTAREQNRQRKYQITNVERHKADELSVFDAISSEIAFKIPKLTFHMNNKAIIIDVYDKKYRKRSIPAFILSRNHNQMNVQTLNEIFDYIEKGIPSRVFTHLKHERVDDTLKNKKVIAIASNDIIFTQVDINIFKEIGNQRLRTVTVMIYDRPKILSSKEEILSKLKLFHDTPTGGHVGINRMYRKIKSLYSWPNMKKIITTYVKSCEKCKHNKHFISIKPKTVITTTPVKPFNIVSIDTVGPFSYSNNRNRYAVTIQCDFSKYIIVIPIPDKSATTIAKAVIEKCILVYGPMIGIKTDQGTEYKGVFDEVCNLLQINHICSTAYHPQTIGALERNHKCLNEYLRIFSNDFKNDWDEWMNYYSFSYNTTPNIEHGFTPFEILFGKKSNTLDILQNNCKPDPLYNIGSYERELKFRLQTIHAIVHKSIEQTKMKRTNDYNSNIIETNLKIGDKVYLKLENRSKLDPLYSGPYIITALTTCNATIANGNRNSIEVHKSRLVKS